MHYLLDHPHPIHQGEPIDRAGYFLNGGHAEFSSRGHQLGRTLYRRLRECAASKIVRCVKAVRGAVAQSSFGRSRYAASETVQVSCYGEEAADSPSQDPIAETSKGPNQVAWVHLPTRQDLKVPCSTDRHARLSADSRALGRRRQTYPTAVPADRALVPVQAPNGIMAAPADD